MAGGGIGEAALIGAVIGGGSSALSGRDPLQGALLGGLTGGAGAGISGLIGGGAAMTPATEAALSSAMTGADAALASEAAGLAALQPTNFANAPASGGLFDAVKSFGTSLTDNQKGTTTQALKDVGSSVLGNIKENPVPYALSGIVPLAMLDPKKEASQLEEKYEGPLRKFKYDPNAFQPYTPQPPNPVYRPVYNSYGLPGYQGGGIVEAMSEANTIGANTGYPQSGITQPYYATGSQTPYSQNMVAGAADTGVNPVTGQMAFAEGGYVYDPKTQTYKLTNPYGVSEGNPPDPATWATPEQNAALNAALTGIANAVAKFGVSGVVGYAKDAYNAISNAFSGGASGGVDAATGLQGQGMSGQTGLYGDAAAGSGGGGYSGDLGGGPGSGGYGGYGGDAAFAKGGITGEGNLDLHIPIDLGGGASNGFNSPMTTFQSANSGSQPAASSRPIFSGYNNDSSNIVEDDTFVGTKAFSGTTQEGLNSLFSLLGGKAMASGGVAKLPNHMAAIDNYRAQAQSGQYNEVLAKAKSGDWNAMLALNQLEGTPNQNYAGGGIADLGSYSDGGRMLKGPGDGMSDSIPATIANKRPARLANEEFVVPADVVSHLGNGSSDAGAKQLYAMMDRVRKARTGNKKQGREINPTKYLPA